MFRRKGILTGLLSAGMIGVMAVSCFADTTQEKLDAAKSRMQDTQSELEETQSRISDLESQKDDAETYLTELNAQLTSLTEELDALEIEYADKQYELSLLVIELQEANEDEETQRDAMALRIQYMYENSTNTGALDALFCAEDFSDFLNRASTMAELTTYDRDMLEAYVETVEEIAEREKELEAEKEQIEELQEETEAKKEEITELCEETSDTIASLAESLSGEQDSVAELLAQVQEQQEVVTALTSQIAEEEAASRAAMAAQASSAASTSAASTSTETQSSANTESSSQETTSSEDTSTQETTSSSTTSTYTGSILTKTKGVNYGPTGKETYYNLNMSGVVSIMRSLGYTYEYWVRSDGVKMFGDYVMVAANLNAYPRGSIVQTSLGTGIVCDTGGFAASDSNWFDIATAW